MATEEEYKALLKQTHRFLNLMYAVIIVTIGAMVTYVINPDFFDLSSEQMIVEVPIPTEEDRDRIENGIHVRTGFIDAEGMYVVIANCTNCHSAKLVTQNRMTAERWNETIKWMQETQNLWDLGENQEIIVNYLVTNYPPKKSGSRRAILTDIEWYEAKD
jgi:hypothetical protein